MFVNVCDRYRYRAISRIEHFDSFQGIQVVYWIRHFLIDALDIKDSSFLPACARINKQNLNFYLFYLEDSYFWCKIQNLCSNHNLIIGWTRNNSALQSSVQQLYFYQGNAQLLHILRYHSLLDLGHEPIHKGPSKMNTYMVSEDYFPKSSLLQPPSTNSYFRTPPAITMSSNSKILSSHNNLSSPKQSESRAAGYGIRSPYVYQNNRDQRIGYNNNNLIDRVQTDSYKRCAARSASGDPFNNLRQVNRDLLLKKIERFSQHHVYQQNAALQRNRSENMRTLQNSRNGFENQQPKIPPNTSSLRIHNNEYKRLSSPMSDSYSTLNQSYFSRRNEHLAHKYDSIASKALRGTGSIQGVRSRLYGTRQFGQSYIHSLSPGYPVSGSSPYFDTERKSRFDDGNSLLSQETLKLLKQIQNERKMQAISRGRSKRSDDYTMR